MQAYFNKALPKMGSELKLHEAAGLDSFTGLLSLILILIKSVKVFTANEKMIDLSENL